MKSIIILLLLLSSATLFAQGGRLVTNPIRNIPKWVRTEFANRQLDERYNIIFECFPYSLQGDFNRDGKRDVAIQIKDKSTGKSGIAIFHGKKAQALSTPITILGAGNVLGKAGTNFDWVNVWNKIKHRDAAQEFGQYTPSSLEGDIITIGKRDSINGAIYWNGREFGYFEEK
jgi:hypothetical protein